MRMRTMVAVVAVGVLVPGIGSATSGLFRTAYTEIAAGNPTGIATGDFNNDGYRDVLTSNAGVGGNDINILEGFGDGTLSPLGQVPTNSHPSGLHLADFDGDDVPDLIVALSNDSTVVFMRGRADQSYFDLPGPPVAVGTSPVGLASGDIDGDGVRDLVVANEGADSAPGSLSVLHGNGDGTFTVLLQDDPDEPGMLVPNLTTDLGSVAVAIGRLNGDAHPDVAVLNERSNSLSLFTGDGGGGFTPAGTLPTGAAPKDFALVDLNGDGRLDLVMAVGNEDAVSVQFGNGDLTFQPQSNHFVGTVPNQVALGDLDEDGALDLVVSNSRSGDISVLLGDGAGGFGPVRTYVADAEPQALTLDDLNDDGLIDAVAATQGGDDGPSVAILRNRGDGTLHAALDIPASNGPSALAVADVDDDALPDLIVTGDSGEVLILPGRPNGFGPPITLAPGERALGVAATDLNGDSLPDLVVADHESNRVAVIIATGPGTFAAPQLHPVAEGPGSVTTGDFNADGRVDIAVSAIGPPGRASVLLQQAGGGFAAARNTTVGDTPLGIVAIDANCDGRDDLVVANQASNLVSVLRSNGDGSFTVVQELPDTQVGQGPIALAVADFNRDGTADFVVSNAVAPSATPSVRAFRGACDAPFAPLSSTVAGNLVSAIVARDFTGDQIVDLGLVNQTDNAMRVLVGNGDGTFRRTLLPDNVSRMPIAIAAGDFDGDGRYDAATANSDPSANNVSVLSNCARDPGCDPFGQPGPAGSAALRGDGNGDGHRTAADLVAVAAELADGDGQQVEAIAGGSFGGDRVAPGVDANGDGIITAQDGRAVARYIFGGV